jgi:uncharacterized DUF497 family protein
VGYSFEWDRRKAAANARKHGASFEEAITVFDEPQSILLADPDHSFEEMRYLLLGSSTRSRLLVVAFVVRAPRIRLISARRATWFERRSYEEEA